MVFLCLMTNYVFSQKTTGKIYDAFTKEALVGAQIQFLTATQNGTISNADGNFELKTINENLMLKISCIGYISQEVKALNNLVIALQPNTQELESVVVTANRGTSLRSESPMAISQLSAKLIDETKANQAFEILNKTPGVMVSSLGNEQHFMSIRQPMGTSPYYLYLEDGLPMRPLGIFNHNAMLEINQFTLSSIEVVKGPVSSIYGPEAVGGAVNFVMQKPTIVPTAKIGFQVDNWGFRRLQFGAGAKIKKIGFYIGGLSSKQTNSWMTNSDYTKTAINARLEYYFSSNTRLIGSLVYGKYFSEMSGSIDSVAFYNKQYKSIANFAYRKSDSYRTRFTLEHDWNKHTKSFLTLFYRNNKLGQNPAYAIRWDPVLSTKNDPQKAKGEVNSNDFESIGAVSQHSISFEPLKSKIILGTVFDHTINDFYAYFLALKANLNTGNKSVANYEIIKERPDSMLVNYNGIINNFATYAQYDLEPLKNLHLSLGIRYDVMHLSYSNYINNTNGKIAYKCFTPKIGATYNLNKNTGFYGNYAQGFSPPSLTAIFRPKPNTQPVEFYTNLKPAYFDNYEIGAWATILQNTIKLDIALYLMKGKNELLNIRQSDNSTDYQSAGKTLHQGIEFGLTANPSEQIAFRLGGTTALHRFEDFQVSAKETDKLKKLDKKIMPNSPLWTINTEWNYYPNWFKNFRISNEWQYVSGWYQNQINTSKSKGYIFLNLRAGYTWKSIEIYTNIMNLTDELYATTSAKGNNSTDRTNYYAGTPRTYLVGIQYNWAGKK